MLKITKNEYINSDKIEAIAIYESVPVKKFAKDAKEKEFFKGAAGKVGYKTIVVMDDGFVFLCPLLPSTYLSRLDGSKYIIADPNRYALKKEYIREISTKLTAKQRNLLREAKMNGKYINLSKNKSSEYYVFMTSGRIYSLHNIRNFASGYLKSEKNKD